MSAHFFASEIKKKVSPAKSAFVPLYVSKFTLLKLHSKMRLLTTVFYEELSRTRLEVLIIERNTRENNPPINFLADEESKTKTVVDNVPFPRDKALKKKKKKNQPAK